MRAALAVVVLMAGCASSGPAPVPPPAEPVADQDWVGTIGCDTIPDLVTKRLNQRFVLQVRGGVARYERNVLLADTSIASGFLEHGQGSVGAGGALNLTGDGQSRQGSYAAEYSGTLAPNGQAHLVGVQHWRFERHANYNRACQIDLHRQG